MTRDIPARYRAMRDVAVVAVLATAACFMAAKGYDAGELVAAAVTAACFSYGPVARTLREERALRRSVSPPARDE